MYKEKYFLRREVCKKKGEPMTIGKSIKLYLVNGNPSGVICSYLSNWNGQAIKIPRNKLADVKKRDEVNNIGVYLLFGYSNENPMRN